MNTEGAVPRRIAAFFDVDGTLVPEPSLERRFFERLRWSGAIPLSNYFRWSVEALRLLPKGIACLAHANKFYLRGVRVDQVFQLLESVLFYQEGIERVAWQARQGHEVVLVTGTLEPLAKMVAAALECELEAQGIECRVLVCATRLEENRGRWTGRLAGGAMYGEAKFRTIAHLARERGTDLSLSHAYGNTLLDRRMLSAVGQAHAVNPGKEMAKLANLLDWPIWHWHQEKKVKGPGISRREAKIQPLESHV
jgi:HAD superfamily hydrolase (TIGR01490 family)